jgi:ABC-type glycerol-3-phosphate transport system substrate-binding protein
MKRLLFIFILMALVLTACAAGVASGSQTEIGQNKEKWQNANISHYRYNLFISCFCAFNEDMPLIIEVQDAKVVSMGFQSGKEIDPVLHETFDKYATIDRLFTELEADINGAADVVTAKYDHTYGFPTEVTIDFVQEATDDELYLTISNFEELP